MLHKTLRPEHIVPMSQSKEEFGLTTLRALNIGEIIGVSHVEDERFEDGFIRTYLGSLINHAEYEEASCEYISFGEIGERILYLTTQEIIYPGAELTVCYGKIKPLDIEQA